MKILPINHYETSYKGPKMPNAINLVDKTKQEYIEELKLISAFKKFENDFRATMETFVYMIKNIG